MNIILALFQADIKGASVWFHRHTLSKLAVSAGFLLLLLLIIKVIYSISFLFFINLTAYEEFGLLSATYLLQASIVVLFWFILSATIVSTLSFLLVRNIRIEYLLSLPIQSVYLQIWLFIRSLTVNIALLLITLTPIMLAFARVFLAGATIQFLANFLFVLFVLVCFSTSLGTLGGFASAKVLKGKGILFAPIAAAIFIGTLILIFRLIFPHEIFLLSQATPTQFWRLYNSLPLNNPLFPSYWLTLILLGKSEFFLPLIIFTFCLSCLSILIQSQTFTKLYQSLQEYGYLPADQFVKSETEKLSKTSKPIVVKDWLSIIRSPAEVSYGIFLILLSLVFFSLLSIATNIHYSQTRWEKELVLFSFVWLAFFTTAYLLRLVFSLVAREGPYAWHIFTLPQQREKILLNKLLLGLFLSIPQIFLAVIMWRMMPFLTKGILFLPLFSLITVIALSLLTGLCGAIMPNFADGRDPEKVSTSATGIMTLLLAIVVTGFHGFLINGILGGQFSIFPSLIVIVASNFFLLFFLSFLARRSVNNYQF